MLALCQVYAQRSPQEALQTLIEGNERFSNDKSLHPDRTSERREETAEKQEPFAVILGCSDSRVAPEIIFDQGIGDLFIVRVAGNVVGAIEMASIEYSAIYLHSCLVIVLGHESCGAVKAVMAGTVKNIEPVAKLIQPAIKDAGGDLENAIKANVRKVVEQLEKNKVLKGLITSEKLLIKGGYYNFHNGKVELL